MDRQASCLRADPNERWRDQRHQQRAQKAAIPVANRDQEARSGSGDAVQLSPLIQPAATSCPAERTDQPVVRITFKDKTTGQPVARASADSGANFTWAPSDGAWECYAVGLDIAGRRGIAVGGNVIGPLQRLLDASLAKPSGK